MNRRKAVFRIFGISAFAVSSTALWKFFDMNKIPDLMSLENKKKLIAEIAETIIPGGDSPGAKAVRAEDFILKMVKDCTETKSQNSFISGLHELENYVMRNYDKSYVDCSVKERIDILTHFENKDDSNNLLRKIRHKLTGDSFVSIMKHYTVIGYCTSELGATKGLAYDYIPSTFEGCKPLEPNQKSWATK